MFFVSDSRPPQVPTIDSSLFLWLDGADPLGGRGTVSDGTALDTWYDKSPIGNNANRIGGGTGRPTYQSNLYNGLGGVEFLRTSSQYFQIANHATLSPSRVLCSFVVQTYEQPATDTNTIFAKATDGENAFCARMVGGGTSSLEMLYQGAGLTLSSGVNPVINTTYVVQAYFDGSTCRSYIERFNRTSVILFSSVYRPKWCWSKVLARVNARNNYAFKRTHGSTKIFY
jgi:hypothetical protein